MPACILGSKTADPAVTAGLGDFGVRRPCGGRPCSQSRGVGRRCQRAAAPPYPRRSWAARQRRRTGSGELDGEAAASTLPAVVWWGTLHTRWQCSVAEGCVVVRILHVCPNACRPVPSDFGPDGDSTPAVGAVHSAMAAPRAETKTGRVCQLCRVTYLTTPFRALNRV